MFVFRKNFGNQKLQQIVETAWGLFWRFGIRRVTVEEICEKAGVSKNTFYKHFTNKLELIRFIMKEMAEQSIQDYLDIMSQNIPFEEKVRQSIDLKYKQTEHISAEFFNDIHVRGDEDLKNLITENFEKGIQVIYKTFMEAQKKGDIRKDTKPEFIVYFLNNMIDMAKDEKLRKMYDDPHDLIMELNNFFFYGILPRNLK